MQKRLGFDEKPINPFTINSESNVEFVKRFLGKYDVYIFKLVLHK